MSAAAEEAGTRTAAGVRRVAPNLRHMVRLLRPRQWVKNLLVFAGPLFGGVLGQPGVVSRALLTFVAFCAVSSAAYCVNDVRDAALDRLHPQKAQRPVASGMIGARTAVTIGIVVALVGLAIGAAIDRTVALLALLYLILMALYSLWAREREPLDVFIIAAGFVIRAIAGAAMAAVQASVWMLALTVLLSLLLGFGKRRAELALSGRQAIVARQSLSTYTVEMLDQVLSVLAASAIVLYAIYAVSISQRLGSGDMILTWPLVVFGILHYLRLSHTTTRPPDELLIGDRTLLAITIAYAAAAAAILYLHLHLLQPVPV